MEQQQQLEKQIQLLQQQQEMLLPGRASREAAAAEPGLSQGSASQHSRGPSAPQKDLANGAASPDPAAPAAAEGLCSGNGQGVRGSVCRCHLKQEQRCPETSGLQPR